MSHDPIAGRYARTLFDTVKAEGPTGKVLEEIQTLQGILEEHAELRDFLINPDIEAEEKMKVLDRLMGTHWSELVRSFVRMVIALGRAEHLSSIAQAFDEAVRADARRLTAVVRSARPLTKTRLKQLQTTLERSEDATIEIETEDAPELLGGFQVVLGHRVIDGSLRRTLDELRQRLKSVPVQT